MTISYVTPLTVAQSAKINTIIAQINSNTANIESLAAGSGMLFDVTNFEVDNLTVDTVLVVKDPNDPNGDYIDIQDVEVDGDPNLQVTEGLWVMKDIYAEGFLGSNQGAVLLGHGLTGGSDPPKIALVDSGTGFDKLLICLVDGSTPAKIRAAYYSSDDSAGESTTITIGANTLTVKNGLIVAHT